MFSFIAEEGASQLPWLSSRGFTFLSVGLFHIQNASLHSKIPPCVSACVCGVKGNACACGYLARCHQPANQHNPTKLRDSSLDRLSYSVCVCLYIHIYCVSVYA